MLTKEEIGLVYEALMSAWTELNAIEADSDDYVASGHLMEQLEEAISLVRDKR